MRSFEEDTVLWTTYVFFCLAVLSGALTAVAFVGFIANTKVRASSVR